MDIKIESKFLLRTFNFRVFGDCGYIFLQTDEGYKQISKDGFVGEMMYAKNEKDFKNKCRKFIKNIVRETFGNTSENLYCVYCYDKTEEVPTTITAGYSDYESKRSTYNTKMLPMMIELKNSIKKYRQNGCDDKFCVYVCTRWGYGGNNIWELCTTF